MSDHTIKFGADYENNDIYNLFGRRTNGSYQFRSLADFIANKSSRYQLYSPTGAGYDSMAAIWGLKKLGLFVQDTWQATPNLTLNFGVRYDEANTDSKPKHNPDFETTFGYDNAKVSLKGLFQPRFGFNYKLDTERASQLRGGIGLFQGAAANVWLSNPYTNTGLNYVDYFCSSGTTGFSPNRADQLNIAKSCGTPAGSVDVMAPDFEQPSVWKANLAFDTQLPWYGILAAMEMVFTKNNSAIVYEHLNLGAPTGYGLDGRALYWGTTAPSNWRADGSPVTSPVRAGRTTAQKAFNDILLAKNTDKGYSNQLTLSLQKPFSRTSDWSWNVAYTHTQSREASALTSSTSFSQWRYQATFNPNEIVLAPSAYEIPHRLSMALSWRHRFFGDYMTTFSTFGEIRNGRNFSYVYNRDANGDGVSDNDLFYIPRPGEVIFGSAAEETAYWAMANADKYLSTHQGQVATRNSGRSPWVKNFDVRISQELPGFMAGHKSELWLDILNVGNLMNNKWGRIEEYGFPQARGVAEFGGIDPVTKKYVYRFNGADQTRIYDDRGISRWALQVGFRYKF